MRQKAIQQPSSIATLADVARRAAVSTATVSRCLNSPEQVTETTRERVMAAVQELGYTPNFSARALAARRTNTIGAIIPTMENAIFARGIQAFQEALGEYGMTLLIASSAYREDLEAAQIRTLVARGADALLLIGHHRGEAVYRFLMARRVPVLVAWAYDVSATQVSIGFDNRQAMQTLTEQVLLHGHRRIAVISAEQANNDRARERVIGVRLALQQQGLDAEQLVVIETPYAIENGETAFRQLMARNNPPTAVLCGNDVLAVGALRGAKQLGLAVPGQVSITGFDDIELASIVTPALTTVHVPHRDMGRQAAHALVAMLQQPHPPPSVQLPTHLCLRETLGPAP